MTYQYILRSSHVLSLAQTHALPYTVPLSLKILRRLPIPSPTKPQRSLPLPPSPQNLSKFPLAPSLAKVLWDTLSSLRPKLCRSSRPPSTKRHTQPETRGVEIEVNNGQDSLNTHTQRQEIQARLKCSQSHQFSKDRLSPPPSPPLKGKRSQKNKKER